MPEKKPSNADLVIRVVRESPEPLPFAEIVNRVNAISPITTRNPKGTIRNAISQSRLVVSTGDGRYGWKYRIINGAAIRLPLSAADLAQRRVIYSDELRDALWPAFFEIQKWNEREPVILELPDGRSTAWTLEFLGTGTWGTGGTTGFWDWLGAVDARPGDELIFRVLDGEARRYAVGFQPRSERDEAVIAARNQQILQAVDRYSQRTHGALAIWDVSSYLLSTGQYRHPVPPDPLVLVLEDKLWAPELPLGMGSGGWMLAKEPLIDPLVASLLEQVGEPPRRRRSKNEAHAGKGSSPNRGAGKETARPVASNQIYQLKVTLEDIHPPIWRRIQVQSDFTLPQLHAVLQIVMDWTNSHLHGFRAGGKFIAEPHPDYLDLEVIDERPIRLSQIAPEVGAHFIYEYDFGDSWDHALIVEKIFPPDPGVAYPRCIDGKRACPPEDVGGPPGYAAFLAAIHNPRHLEHDDWLQWAGGSFDPEAFDLQMVNELLRSFYALLVEGS